MKKICFVLLILNIILFGCHQNQSPSKVIDDPYLWLEDIEGEKALEWVKAQNKLSGETFTNLPLFDTLKSKFLEVFNDKDQIIYPNMVGEFVYNLWQDEKNERGVWRRMLKADFLKNSSTWEVVLDLDELSKTENRKWVFQGADWLPPENKYCLVTLSDGGKDESVIREFDATNKSFVGEGFVVDESKNSATWVDKNTIMVATDFGSGTMTTSGYPRIAKLWRRGKPIEEAEKIFEADTTIVGVFTQSFNTGKQHHNFVSVWKSTFENELYMLTDKGIQKIDFPLDAEISGMFKNEIILALQSDWKIDSIIHPAGSLVSLNADEFTTGNSIVKTIFAPGERSSFISMLAANDFIIINSMENVQSKLTKYYVAGDKWIANSIAVPALGSISLIASNDQSADFFFKYSNLITPPTLYWGDTKGITAVKKQKDFFDKKNLFVNQYEAVSKDGTKIPYFIVHRSDLQLNGKNPTLVYAYGGFNVAEQPSYSSVNGIGWLELGGVYVIANIRGGGEFGPSWHKAAQKEKRQNAYEDFYAVSEDLISRQITSHDFLGAFGWSNGGLLAGVAFTQRPDLYNAVVVGAPLLDMKRFSKMLAGASWVGEYGDPDIPEEWEYLKAYSPYHNLLNDKKYPEVLFITSTKDDRVHPGHARKMAAKMIAMGHPLFYHETIEGGHGAASTKAQEAYIWATIYSYLNMKLKDKPRY